MRTLVLLLALLVLTAASARASVIVTGTQMQEPQSEDTGVGGPALLDGVPVWGETGIDRTFRLVTPSGSEAQLPAFPAAAFATTRVQVASDGREVTLVAESFTPWRGGEELLEGRRTLSGPLGAVREVEAQPLPRFVAGPVRAFRSGGELVVRDRATGQDRYRAPLPDGWYLNAVQADGTVLVGRLTDDGTGAVIGVISQAAPTLRPLPGLRRALVGRVLAGGLIATLEAGAVVVHDLEAREVARVPAPEAKAPIAFDGTTVAWSERPCAAGLVVTWKVGDPPPPPRGTRCTAADVNRARPTRRGLRVALRCPAATAPLGCSTGIRATVRTVRRGRGVGPAVRLGPAVTALLPGEQRTLRLETARPADLRRLARTRVANVRVGVRAQRRRGGAERFITGRLRVR